MFTRIRSLARGLTGGQGRRLIHHLVGQLAATVAGVELARAVTHGEVEPGEARDEIAGIEHRGDEHRRRLIIHLSSALAPPIDREDLFRLSRSVDDVLDNVRDLVREMDLFGIDQEPMLGDLLEEVAAGVRALERGVCALLDNPGDARDGAVAAKKNDIRPRYQQAVARLLVDDGPVTGLVLKRRQLLRRVDVVGLRLGEAADALADGMVKRSH